MYDGFLKISERKSDREMPTHYLFLCRLVARLIPPMATPILLPLAEETAHVVHFVAR